MKKRIFTYLLLSAVTILSALAQNNAVYQGLRVPQLTTEQRDLIQSGAVSSSNPRAKGQMIFNLDTDCTEYWNGNKWLSLCQDWFYMPSIVFDVSTPGSFSKNLYDEYKEQLNSNYVVGSDGAPEMILTSIPEDTDFYYYVTAYDPKVFSEILISKKGMMTYKIIGSADDDTFINIVFVKK